MHVYLLVALTKRMFHNRVTACTRGRKVSISHTAGTSPNPQWHARASPLSWAQRQPPDWVMGGRTVLGTRALVPWLTAFERTGGCYPLPKPSAADPTSLCPGLYWRPRVHSCCSALQGSCKCCPFCTPLFSFLLHFCLTPMNFSSFPSLVLACVTFPYSYSFNDSHVPGPPYPSATRCSSVVSASLSRGRGGAWARRLNLSSAQRELFLVRDHSSLETTPGWEQRKEGLQRGNLPTGKPIVSPRQIK